MMFIAFTRKVVRKGKISVSQGQCVAIANTSAAADTKNRIHISTRFFVADAIILFFYKNIVC